MARRHIRVRRLHRDQPHSNKLRLLAFIASLLIIAGMLLWGLGLFIVQTLQDIGSDSSAPAAAAAPLSIEPDPAQDAGLAPDVQKQRDELAQRPMPDNGNPYAHEPSELTTRQAPLMVLPRPTGIDATGVRTGYPQTPEGAVAQLAAIDQAAMESASLPGVRAVISGWAMKGGPTPESWSTSKAMAELLSGAELPSTGSPRLSVRFTPAMGMIKGTVGDDYVVACVNFAVETALYGNATAAVADCQRMVWSQGRWQIGPGPEPAVPQSVWPDTDAALDAGWKDLADA